MRRPGELRFLHPRFTVVYILSECFRPEAGAETGKRLQSRARTRAGYYCQRRWNETLKLELQTYFRLPSPNLHEVFSSLTPELSCLDSHYPKFKEIGCVSLQAHNAMREGEFAALDKIVPPRPKEKRVNTQLLIQWDSSRSKCSTGDRGSTSYPGLNKCLGTVM